MLLIFLPFVAFDFFAFDFLRTEISSWLSSRYTTTRRRRNLFSFARAAAAAVLARVTLLAWFSFRARSLLWMSSRTRAATPWRISAHSGSVCDLSVEVSGKYTHPALCRSMFRVRQARTNENHLLLSSLPAQHGTRQGRSSASSILSR